MKTDSESTFQERNTGRIDIAQEKMDEFFSKHPNIFYKRIGFDEKKDKIPKDAWFKFPAFFRNMPDACAVGEKFNFIESKGCRSELHLKIEDIESYDEWDSIAPLYIFAYSTVHKKGILVNYKHLEQDSRQCDTDVYNDNNKVYRIIPWNMILAVGAL